MCCLKGIIKPFNGVNGFDYIEEFAHIKETHNYVRALYSFGWIIELSREKVLRPIVNVTVTFSEKSWRPSGPETLCTPLRRGEGEWVR